MSTENQHPGQQGTSPDEREPETQNEQQVVAEPSFIEPGTLEPVVITTPGTPDPPAASTPAESSNSVPSSSDTASSTSESTGPQASSWATPAPTERIATSPEGDTITTALPHVAPTAHVEPEPAGYSAPARGLPAQTPAPTTGAPAGIPGGEIYAAHQISYATAPVPPKKRSNRGGGTLIALVGAVAFAVVYAAVAFVIFLLDAGSGDPVATLLRFMASGAYIAPVVAFAIALILTVLIVNRARWWAYVLGGFLVALFVYAGAIAGSLIAIQAWNLDAEAQLSFVRSLIMDPLPLGAAIVAREVTVWAGAWISARGRKLTARNATAREEYDRKLAESPSSAPVGSPAW